MRKSTLVALALAITAALLAWTSGANAQTEDSLPEVVEPQGTATTAPPTLIVPLIPVDERVPPPSDAIEASPASDHEHEFNYDPAADRAAEVALSEQTIAQQLRAYEAAADRTGVDRSEMIGRATVSITLETPLPVQALQEVATAEKYALPDEALNVTLYAEMDDGYPIVITGEPRFDLVGELVRFVADASDRGQLGYDPADVADRAVILGFTLSLDDHARLSDSITGTYGPTVDLVSVSTRPESLRPVGRLTLDEVAEHKTAYEAAEVGR